MIHFRRKTARTVRVLQMRCCCFVSADNQAYAHANKLFLEAVAGIYEEGDIVLVHDYDLMLLPALLRKRFPDITCGFFLHCPFPSTGERYEGTLCYIP